MYKKLLALFLSALALGAVSLLVTGQPIVPAAAALALPKMDNGMEGFGGFITKVTPCICADIGMLLTVAGPFGGDYLFSFTRPPSIKLGNIFMVGGPVLGAVKGDGRCGTDKSQGSCVDLVNGKIITYIGGVIQ